MTFQTTSNRKRAGTMLTFEGLLTFMSCVNIKVMHIKLAFMTHFKLHYYFAQHGHEESKKSVADGDGTFAG